MTTMTDEPTWTPPEGIRLEIRLTELAGTIRKGQRIVSRQVVESSTLHEPDLLRMVYRELVEEMCTARRAEPQS